MVWFKAWIQALEDVPAVVTFEENDVCVGLMFLQVRDQQTGPFKWKTAWVNQTGLQDFDQVWIEYNSVICQENIEQDCIQAFFRLLPKLKVNELNVSMTDSEARWLGAAKRVNWKSESEAVYAASKQLESVSKILTTYSKNTRYQVKRAMKLLTEKYGDINVKVAKGNEEKAHFFSELSELHIQRWQHTSEGSGFTNPAFIRHHEYLLSHAPDMTEIVRVDAGDTTLGYCLNFICNKHVSFYCSGIRYSDDDNKMKPGYVVHHCLMQEYARRGMLSYDFLGGFSQYKASLSDRTYQFHTLRFTSPTIKGYALLWLRACKKRVKALTERLA
ncbi:GNAT family N-acetyltransferase [Alteromonas sp. H39]|uniref:GNAT family N-acetyltransferase n=1 Tax=Alteromonas sp. H39 TaxID=3389876 RepID=UPI0039E11DE2